MGFHSSIKDGKVAELKVGHLLSHLGQIDYNNTIDYDISVADITIEVKHDKYANKSGNIAIEYWNSKKDKASGIYASNAGFWAIYLNEDEVYLTSLTRLKDFCRNTKPYRMIQSGGDNNADLLLYKKETILPIFVNLVGLSQKEITAYLYPTGQPQCKI